MTEKTVRVWITRYALTQGIFVIEGEVGPPHMISFKGSYITECYHGKDWHRTSEAALKRAEEMRKLKIASLKASIERVQKIQFKADA